MKARYWLASARIEIFARSTFCWRASVSSRSSGPSKPSTSTISVGSSAAAIGGGILGECGRFRRAFMSRAVMPATRIRLLRSAAQMLGPRRVEIDVVGRAGATRAPRAARASAVAAELRAIGRDLVHFAQIAVAMKHEIAAGSQRRRVRSAIEPVRAPIDTSSLINAPANPIKDANHLVNDNRRGGGRKPRIEGCEYHMGGHAERQSRRAA